MNVLCVVIILSPDAIIYSVSRSVQFSIGFDFGGKKIWDNKFLINQIDVINKKRHNHQLSVQRIK